MFVLGNIHDKNVGKSVPSKKKKDIVLFIKKIREFTGKLREMRTRR